MWDGSVMIGEAMVALAPGPLRPVDREYVEPGSSRPTECYLGIDWVRLTSAIDANGASSYVQWAVLQGDRLDVGEPAAYGRSS